MRPSLLELQGGVVVAWEHTGEGAGGGVGGEAPGEGGEAEAEAAVGVWAEARAPLLPEEEQ